MYMIKAYTTWKEETEFLKQNQITTKQPNVQNQSWKAQSRLYLLILFLWIEVLIHSLRVTLIETYADKSVQVEEINQCKCMMLIINLSTVSGKVHKKTVPEDHRAIVFPRKINRIMWRCKLRTLSGKIHPYSCSISKIWRSNFTYRNWCDLPNSVPVNFKHNIQ